MLIALAEGPWAKWASAVFTPTSMLFGLSALYHRFDWKPRTKVLLKRIDHANIFLLIAGTYTPMAILALPPGRAGCCSGSGRRARRIGFRVFWIHAPRWLYVLLYLLGWAAVMYLGDLLEASVAMMVLVIVGGVLYTIGAIVYALKKPNPWPGHFGFHEIFHVCTVLAFICHWTATLIIAIDPVYHGLERAGRRGATRASRAGVGCRGIRIAVRLALLGLDALARLGAVVHAPDAAAPCRARAARRRRSR